MSDRINIQGRIKTQLPQETGTLGEALKLALKPEAVEELESRPLPIHVAKRVGSHKIAVYRSRNRLVLHAPEGQVMAEGTFNSREELLDNVRNFISKHPKTTVLTYD